MKHVALLRGINLGSHNRLPMRDLRVLFEEAGCTEVLTYIQSGNVIYNAPQRARARLPEEISRGIAERFGFRIPVITRSMEELEQTVRGNPYLKAGTPEKLLYVYFLADTPDEAAVEKLDAGRSQPDTFRVCGRDIYAHLPDGVARTKLTNAWFDSKLSTVSTARNWATVLKIHELLRTS